MKHKALVLELNKIGALKFGEFTLKNGSLSPVYIDLRSLVSFPGTMKKVAGAYTEVLAALSFDRMAAVPYAAMPIVGAVAVLSQLPWIFTRKEVKDYGTKKLIEGNYKKGETIVVVDDMTTDGTSKLEVIKPFEDEGLKIKDIVVLIDRGQGAKKRLASKGYKLHSVLTLHQAMDILLAEKVIDRQMYQNVEDFLAANQYK